MADSIITKQELIDAQKDAVTLKDAVNGNETGIVAPRLNDPYPTLPAAIQKIEGDGAAAVAKLENTGGFISAPTLTALQAITPEYDYQLARVDATGDEYRWNPALTTTVKWEPTGRNFLSESKTYTDNKVAAGLTTVDLYKTDDESIIPVLTDASNNVLIGYDIENEKPVLANLEVVEQSAIDEVKTVVDLYKTDDESIIPVLTDASNNVLIGYDIENEKPVLAGLDTQTKTNSNQKKQAFSTKLLTKAINHILFYGQSLSVGATATTVLSTSQPYFNTTFDTSPRMDSVASNVVPLVETYTNPASDGGANRGETPCSGAANYASRAMMLENNINPSNHKIFASTAGHGGYKISQLNKGSSWYNFMLNQVTKAFQLNGSDFKTQVINWVQGETDLDQATTYAVYLAALKQLCSDMNSDIKAITGQTDSIPFITYQCSYKAATSSAIALAQLHLAQDESNNFYFATPTYRLPYFTDNTHLTNVGYKLMGAYFGRAYKELVIDNVLPQFLNPKSAKISGSKIIIDFEVPTLPLVLDTTNLAATTNSGFKVLDSSGVAVAVNSVSISDTTVILTLASALTANATVRYALDYLGAGLNILNGASGNLRDSTNDSVTINSTAYQLFNACPHFQLTAFLDKGI